jgi:NADH:ubiquinone oxidoreductase subunit 2 (subunit N)
VTSSTGSHEQNSNHGRSINQTVALAFGAIYTLVAVLGFFVSETFAEQDDDKLLGIFEVNHLHNIVHLLIGLALIAASRRHDSARGANLAIGATYLLVFLVGLFILDSEVNILALNSADNVLHLLSGGLLVLVALTQDKNRARSHA